jgi:serine/threonine-protein kinase HipA
MVFNVVARNQDDHTKNISFVMDKAGVWRLAPAYDLTWAYNPQGLWTSRHQMSIAGKTEDLTHEDLLSVADHFGIRRPEAIIEQVVEAVRQWPDIAADVGVDESYSRRISSTHRVALES